MGLTLKKVAALKTPGRYFDQHGLYLQVEGENNRSWLFRYETRGKEHWHGLGPVHTYTLDEARERARQARQLLRSGKDPIDIAAAERRARALEAAKALTFEECATQWFAQHERRWRNVKVRAGVMAGLKRWVFPIIGKTGVRNVDTPAVLRVLEQKVGRGTFSTARAETAGKIRGHVKDILNWAKVRNLRDGDNPCDWSGLKHALPAQAVTTPVVHLAALPFVEVPAFMVELKTRPAVSARALEFCILTAARTGEVIGAKWPEIDIDNAVWTVPAERMKTLREHKVPMSKQAVALLRALPREKHNEFVFLGTAKGCGLSGMSMLMLLRRMGRSDFTVHGFRSSFRDWVEETTNFPGSVAEAALAHVIGDKVEAAYRRGDLFAKRAKLMQAWAQYINTPIKAADVIPLTRRG